MADASHHLAERRSLALHGLIAEQIRRDPRLVVTAQERVRTWLRQGSIGAKWAEAWLKVLARPADEIADYLVDEGQAARDLRQSTPFAGVIDPRTRWDVRRRVAPGGDGT